MRDDTIIAEILAGETALYADLVDRYLPLVRGVCASYVFDPAAQDDLVQESFLAGYLGLNGLRKRDAFGPWLAQIARHKCTSWMRGQARQTDVRKRLAAKDLALDGEASPLVIGEENAFLPELLLEDLVPGVEIIVDFLLLTVNPAGEIETKQLPGL